MEPMKTWCNNVGPLMIRCIDLSSTTVAQGDPVLNRWYGLFQLDERFLHKLKLIYKNGYRS